jgi:hypothetical protein
VTNLPTSYDNLQKKAADRFLQTALIVDDRLTTNSPGQQTQETPTRLTQPVGPRVGRTATSAKTRAATSKSASSSASGDALDETAGRSEAEKKASNVHLKGMADHFADLSLTCGVLKPADGEKREDVNERIVKAAKRVDIVVMDWVLDEEGAFTAKEAVGRIVGEDKRGRRLIAIYTTWRELRDIHDQLVTVLEPEQSDPRALTMDVGGTRIVIFHKGGPTLDSDYAQHKKTEKQLPATLVTVFREMVSGLVPAIALQALAAARENTHRLLSRLSTDLDLGYLGHLLRLTYAEDAEQHLIDAIAGEFRAVIEDDDQTRLAAEKGADAWLRARKGQLRLEVKAIKTLGPVLGDKQAFGKWKNAQGQDLQTKLAGAVIPKDITELLVKPADAKQARLSDAGFAHLLAFRTNYDRPLPGLHLGAIVREEQHPDHYWVCIQPVCDSVRLSAGDPTAFLMLPLELVPHGDKDTKIRFVLDEKESEPVHLWLWDDTADLELMRLLPNDNGSVTFRSRGDGKKTVVTQEGLTLIWVGQLKTAHALRVANAYGTDLTRVGLDESDWLLRHAEGKRPGRVNRLPLATRAAEAKKLRRDSQAPPKPPGARNAASKSAARKPASRSSKVASTGDGGAAKPAAGAGAKQAGAKPRSRAVPKARRGSASGKK